MVLISFGGVYMIKRRFLLILLGASILLSGCLSVRPSDVRPGGTEKPPIPPEAIERLSKRTGISTDPKVYPHIRSDGAIVLFVIWDIEFVIPAMNLPNWKGAANPRETSEIDWVIAYSAELIRENPGDTLAYLRRAVCYYQRNNEGDMDLALEDCNQVLSLNPDETIAYYIRGMVYAKKGLPDPAIADLNRLLSLNQYNMIGIYYVLGQVYNKMGDTGSAIDAFEQAYRLDPDFADVSDVLDSLRERKQ
jgi:hypothetical protein